DKPLSFTQDEFVSAIDLPICKENVPIPPKETGEKNKKDKDANPTSTQGEHPSAKIIPSSKQKVKKDEGTTKNKEFMAIVKDEPFVGKADARRKENNLTKEVLFTKSDVSTSEFAPMITSDSEEGSDIQEPLPLASYVN
nr:hypothetical protein [Tanacetum cinerariifolium]